MIAEEESKNVRSWLGDDPHIVTWCWTLVELTGAVERLYREEKLSREERRASLGAFRRLAETWDEVTDVYATRARALALLARHRLRAADAAQLGAALLVARDDPASLEFACLDDRLATAAELEGLHILL